MYKSISKNESNTCSTQSDNSKIGHLNTNEKYIICKLTNNTKGIFLKKQYNVYLLYFIIMCEMFFLT